MKISESWKDWAKRLFGSKKPEPQKQELEKIIDVGFLDAAQIYHKRLMDDGSEQSRVIFTPIKKIFIPGDESVTPQSISSEEEISRLHIDFDGTGIIFERNFTRYDFGLVVASSGVFSTSKSVRMPEDLLERLPPEFGRPVPYKFQPLDKPSDESPEIKILRNSLDKMNKLNRQISGIADIPEREPPWHISYAINVGDPSIGHIRDTNIKINHNHLIDEGEDAFNKNLAMYLNGLSILIHSIYRLEGYDDGMIPPTNLFFGYDMDYDKFYEEHISTGMQRIAKDNLSQRKKRQFSPEPKQLQNARFLKGENEIIQLKEVEGVNFLNIKDKGELLDEKVKSFLDEKEQGRLKGRFFYNGNESLTALEEQLKTRGEEPDEQTKRILEDGNRYKSIEDSLRKLITKQDDTSLANQFRKLCIELGPEGYGYLGTKDEIEKRSLLEVVEEEWFDQGFVKRANKLIKEGKCKYENVVACARYEIPECEIIDVLSTDGVSSVVFLGKNSESVDVVIKVMGEEPNKSTDILEKKIEKHGFEGMNERETRNNTRLADFSGVLTSVKHGSIGEKYFRVMKYVRDPLSKKIINEPEFVKQNFHSLFASLIYTVANMHYLGLVHRDIKPDNMYIQDTIDGQKILLGDLETVAKLDEIEVSPGQRISINAPDYMSPGAISEYEIEKEDSTIQTDYKKNDVYSIGVVLYESFTGKKVGSDHESLKSDYRNQRRQMIRENPEEFWQIVQNDVNQNIIDSRLKNIVLNCLNPDQEQRWDINTLNQEFKSMANSGSSDH